MKHRNFSLRFQYQTCLSLELWIYDSTPIKQEKVDKLNLLEGWNID